METIQRKPLHIMIADMSKMLEDVGKELTEAKQEITSLKENQEKQVDSMLNYIMS